MEAGISKTHQIYYSEFASTLVAGVDGIVRDSREGGAYERDRFPPTAVWGVCLPIGRFRRIIQSWFLRATSTVRIMQT